MPDAGGTWRWESGRNTASAELLQDHWPRVVVTFAGAAVLHIKTTQVASPSCVDLDEGAQDSGKGLRARPSSPLKQERVCVCSCGDPAGVVFQMCVCVCVCRFLLNASHSVNGGSFRHTWNPLRVGRGKASPCVRALGDDSIPPGDPTGHPGLDYSPRGPPPRGPGISPPFLLPLPSHPLGSPALGLALGRCDFAISPLMTWPW